MSERARHFLHFWKFICEILVVRQTLFVYNDDSSVDLHMYNYQIDTAINNIWDACCRDKETTVRPGYYFTKDIYIYIYIYIYI